MKKWAMVIDVAKCTNCANCVLTTKDEHVGNDHPGYAASQPREGHEWISIERHTRGSGAMVDVTYVPRMCNHCDDAPCVRAAGDGSIYQRPDGIVIIDPVKARGRKDLVDSCPYGSIHWNEEADVPQKWIFDAHLLDGGWSKPRCVQACPTGALEALHVSDEELEKSKTHLDLEVLKPELGTRPRVFYRNLDRTARWFLGGNVIRKAADGSTENVTDARIVLSIDARELLGATDVFGDFKMDGLKSAAAPYRLLVAHDEFGEATRQGMLTDSTYLGSISLPH
jgi:Fe-S-cluster-containing dehydrogenase component